MTFQFCSQHSRISFLKVASPLDTIVLHFDPHVFPLEIIGAINDVHSTPHIRYFPTINAIQNGSANTINGLFFIKNPGIIMDQRPKLI